MTTTIPGERGQLTALRGAWLFDGTGPALIPDPVVVIEGSVIRDVRSGGRIPETLDGGTVIDLPGATLLPGLVDTHVHLAFDEHSTLSRACCSDSCEEGAMNGTSTAGSRRPSCSSHTRSCTPGAGGQSWQTGPSRASGTPPG